MNDTVAVIAIVQSSVSEFKGLKVEGTSLQFQYYMLLVVRKMKDVATTSLQLLTEACSLQRNHASFWKKVTSLGITI